MLACINTQGNILSDLDELPYVRLSEIYVDLHKILDTKDSKVSFLVETYSIDYY